MIRSVIMIHGGSARPKHSKHREKGIEPARVAECILRIIESKSPRLRNIIGKEIARTFLMRRLLPESLFEHGARRYLNLDVKG